MAKEKSKNQFVTNEQGGKRLFGSVQARGHVAGVQRFERTVPGNFPGNGPAPKIANRRFNPGGGTESSET